MITYVTSIFCVIGLVIGQILFKVCAIAIMESGSLFSPKPLAALFAALCLYGITSIAWVWVLQTVELGRVYPIMALAFILVPLGSQLVFGERFPPQYFFGVAMIVAGIVVTVRA